MINEIIQLTRNAGDAILGYYSDEIDVSRKEDDSPLTKADLAAHKVIVKGLRELTPEIPIISEEGGIAGYEERKNWKRFWLVDPLDGTKEFIKKNGEFTVNIALIEAEIPVLGVVHIPAKHVTYTGERDSGAYKFTWKKGGDSRTRIYSEAPDLDRPVTVVSSRSHGSDDLEEKLAGRGITMGRQVVAGSSLKFCMVAEGVAGIYPRLGPTMEWDTAAGDAVYRYSGRDKPRNSPLKYNKPSLKNGEFIIGL